MCSLLALRFNWRLFAKGKVPYGTRARRVSREADEGGEGRDGVGSLPILVFERFDGLALVCFTRFRGRECLHSIRDRRIVSEHADAAVRAASGSREIPGRVFSPLRHSEKNCPETRIEPKTEVACGGGFSSVSRPQGKRLFQRKHLPLQGLDFLPEVLNFHFSSRHVQAQSIQLHIRPFHDVDCRKKPQVGAAQWQFQTENCMMTVLLWSVLYHR